MQALLHDLRYGVRVLRKNPGFTAVAVLTLALGIGANTAIFSVVNAVLLRPLPYPQADRLVLVQEDLPKLNIYARDRIFGGVSAAEFLDYQAENEVFTEIAAFTLLNLDLTGQGEAQRIQAARVSASLFRLLGIPPLLGRAFAPQEDQPSSNEVVILSEQLWRRAFGADPSIIGRTVKLDARPYTVVGVMPARLQFPHTMTSFAEAVALWVPLALTDEEKKSRASDFNFGVIGRLKPGASMARARANMEAIAARMQRQHPQIYRGNIEVRANVTSLKERLVKKVRPFLLILLGAVGLVLLIACANIANLLLSRATARQKEIAIRSAIGASTFRLVRQLLTESLLLALLSGGVGVLLAVWAMELILRLGPDDVPRLHDVSLDPLALGFTALVSLLAGLLFGLTPAIQGSRLNFNEALKEAGGLTTRGSRGERLRGLLVVFETASALVLLAGAGLLIRSFVSLLRVPPGFNPEGVVVARTAFNTARYPKVQLTKATYRQVLERLSALPGVQSVGLASNLPLTDEWTIGFRIEGHDQNKFNTAANTWVSNDYFRAMGIQLLKGRTFTDEDREGAHPVVVINETMARRFWPREDAIGKRIRWGGWDAGWLTIVGVAADVKVSSLEAEDTPAVYMPLFQIPRTTRRNVVFIVRTAGDPASLVSSIRGEINAVDAELPVFNIQTMKQILTASMSQRRFSMLLLGMFAVAALLLAASGLYGVMSYVVSQRTREIGIRMALGAYRKDILKLVIGHAMILVLMGVSTGLIVALALTRVISSLLYSVKATDPLTFIAISFLLAGVALLASFLPARRATKIDPLSALRYE